MSTACPSCVVPYDARSSVAAAPAALPATATASIATIARHISLGGFLIASGFLCSNQTRESQGSCAHSARQTHPRSIGIGIRRGLGPLLPLEQRGPGR